jgi:hypothetical protein
MWVLAHVGIAGNEGVDFEARQATLGNMVYNAQSVAPNREQRILDEWQKSRFNRKVFALHLSQGLS